MTAEVAKVSARRKEVQCHQEEEVEVEFRLEKVRHVPQQAMKHRLSRYLWVVGDRWNCTIHMNLIKGSRLRPMPVEIHDRNGSIRGQTETRKKKRLCRKRFF